MLTYDRKSCSDRIDKSGSKLGYVLLVVPGSAEGDGAAYICPSL